MAKSALYAAQIGALGWLLCAVPGTTGRARAQEPGEQAAGARGFAGMQRAGGEITAVNGATVTIRTEEGTTMQIVTTDNTRVMKGRGVTVKVSDLKPGDGVIAAGNLDAPNKTLHAAVLFATDAAQLKALKENLGKTYITGRVTAIDLDNAKMTVERPDHVSQTIGFDEGTSFRRGRGMRMNGMSAEGTPQMAPGGGSGGGGASAGGGGESITLADVKVGDVVAGQGAVKGGVFVPTQLMVNTPGARRRGAGPGTGTAPAQPAAPAGPGGR